MVVFHAVKILLGNRQGTRNFAQRLTLMFDCGAAAGVLGRAGAMRWGRRGRERRRRGGPLHHDK